MIRMMGRQGLEGEFTALTADQNMQDIRCIVFLCLTQKKKRRKHKVLLPKAYDASLPGGGLPPPNPERWLPKWQRSEFKKKKITSAQRKNEVVKGSQGAGKVDENLDRSATAAPSAQPAQSAKPSLPPRKGKGKK